jgi:hypothetical protein
VTEVESDAVDPLLITVIESEIVLPPGNPTTVEDDRLAVNVWLVVGSFWAVEVVPERLLHPTVATLIERTGPKIHHVIPSLGNFK